MKPSPTSSILRPGAAILALASFLGGCTEQQAPEPVATLTLDSTTLELPYPEWRSLRFHWDPLQALQKPGEVSVFVHLLDRDGALVRTFDHPLPQPWTVGETVSAEVQIYQSVLGSTLLPGEYSLTVGLYDRDGHRWPLAGAFEDTGKFEYSVATVTVPPVSSEEPAFLFRGNWNTLEEGGDSQILGRRWLSGTGTLEIQNLEVPGSLWIRLNVPAPAGPDSLRALDGAAPPSFDVSSSCSGAVRSFTPPGIEQMVIPIFPAEDGSHCTLELTPSFLRPASEDSADSLAALEILAWSPAEL